MEIILLAALAAFIFFKLRNELGKVDEEQKRSQIKNFIKAQTINSSSTAIPDNIAIIEVDEKSQKIFRQLSPEIRDNLELVLKNTNISAANFVFGAQKAFEMIIEAFAGGDIKALKPLIKFFFNLKILSRLAKTAAKFFILKFFLCSQARLSPPKCCKILA
jgi:predicted lipid-binding transport protein (Tim44 family)